MSEYSTSLPLAVALLRIERLASFAMGSGESLVADSTDEPESLRERRSGVSGKSLLVMTALLSTEPRLVDRR